MECLLVITHKVKQIRTEDCEQKCLTWRAIFPSSKYSIQFTIMPHIPDRNKEGRKYEQKDLFVLGSKPRKNINFYVVCIDSSTNHFTNPLY